MGAPQKANMVDFEALKKVVESLAMRLEMVEAENKNLKSRVLVLEGEKKANEIAVNWARFTSSNKNKKTNEEQQVEMAVSAIKKDMDKREKSIVITGVALSQLEVLEERKVEDKVTVEEIFDKIGINKAIIGRIHRFRPKENELTSPILVELDKPGDRLAVLKAAKRLGDCEKYKRVYINPDMSQGERKLMRELVNERKEKNNKLEADGRLNKPFRYGIRGFRVVEIHDTRK
jgi:hypothetical protein